jgi:protein-S-isoprenylcysteine O-methyltransferase Ste14
MDVVSCIIVAALAVWFGARTAAWYGGLLLATIFFPLWLAARRQLGTAFSVKPEARHLVTSGLYSKIRHPIYVFGGLAYFGALLALQIWPLLAAWIALNPIQIVRARRESRVLAEAFGAEYQAYLANTWF